MCGILGGKILHISDAEIQTLVSSLRHRGPDGEGQMLEPDTGIFLGHTRLSIIDVTEQGAQPMSVTYKGHLYHISFNGEIYNYKEIRVLLEKEGHVFSSQSDTEVVVRAYCTWGPACLEKFVGMFAFAIFDTHTKEIFLARDRFGVKPLYYYVQDDIFLFASELSTIAHSSYVTKKIDQDGLAAYLQLGYIPAPYTIFSGVKKLLPGQYALYTNNTLSIQTYWDSYEVIQKRGERVSLESLEHTLLKSFLYRMVSDVPVGIFLSGGVDSTLITALLQKSQQETLQTFSIGFEDPCLDEAPYAKVIAEQLQTIHHEVYVSNKEVKKTVFAVAEACDEPFADVSAIPTYLLSKYTRNHVKVVLSGDGGDELFGGYTKYAAVYQLIRMKRWKKRVLSFIVRLPLGIFEKISQIFKKKRPTNLLRKLYKLRVVLKMNTLRDMFVAASSIFSFEEVTHLLQKSPTKNVVDTVYLQKKDIDPVMQMQLWDTQVYLPDNILVKTDRMTMAHGVEGREPFLDTTVLVAALSQKKEDRETSVGTKQVLKDILSRYLSRDYLSRPKRGFVSPIYEWMTSSWGKELIETYLNKEYIKGQALFSAEYVEKVKKNLHKGNAEEVWTLLSFQLWYDVHMK